MGDDAETYRLVREYCEEVNTLKTRLAEAVFAWEWNSKRLAEAEGLLDQIAEFTKVYVVFKPEIGSDKLWDVLGAIFRMIQNFFLSVQPGSR
jgi:hypothetical protein